jgi:hypothetical protein
VENKDPEKCPAGLISNSWRKPVSEFSLFLKSFDKIIQNKII